MKALFLILKNMSDKKKILVVDDEITLRSALVTTLSEDGSFEVLEASDGVMALESIRTNHPDLVLLDIAMPKMDGLTVATTMKAEGLTTKTKIIFLTNTSELSQIATAMSSGALNYFIKADWDLKDVVKKVKEVLA